MPPRGAKNSRLITKSRQNKNKKMNSKKNLNSEEKKGLNFEEKTSNFEKKVISSDSETSDCEKWSSERFYGKIRHQALQLLQELMGKMSSKEFFGFWSQIITKSEKTVGEGSRGLVKLIMKEPLGKMRQSALGVLGDAIVDARMFLVHADEAEGCGAFVTMFGAVGGMLREIHLGLALLLSSERNFSVITQALKCSAALVQVTPYGRMKAGLVGKLARHCR